MRTKLLIVVLVTALGFSAMGQTAKELNSRYEVSVFFEVRPNILMKAEYGSKGKVCSVVFQPNKYSANERKMFIGNTNIDLHELLEVINELAPPETRNGNGLSLGYIAQSGMMWGGFTYDNVRINTKRSFDQKKGRSIEMGPRDDGRLIDYLNSFGAPETASISWIKREGCES
jgi:hypothetical protein